MTSVSPANPKIVSRSEWLDARLELLAREKELTRQYDAVAVARRSLPWVKVEKEYVFEGPAGEVTLAQLFEDRTQLIVRHFMFAPGWSEGCVGCSFLADHIDGARIHLEQHDVSFVAISRAPYREIAAFQKRMGWQFRWVSCYASDFNYDYHVSFRPEEIASGKIYHNFQLREAVSEERAGNSVFSKSSDGTVFHSYSTYGRGDELLVGRLHVSRSHAERPRRKGARQSHGLGPPPRSLRRRRLCRHAGQVRSARNVRLARCPEVLFRRNLRIQ
jgi:predicted dithiol-disulfide oxidoreductase (DUF899 family)